MTSISGTNDNWSSIRLVKLLKGRLASRLDTVFHEVEPIIKTRPIGLEQMTDHDLAHSCRVIHRIGQILPNNIKLKQTELYLLLTAALLHDAGMWSSKEEVLKLPQDKAFLEWGTRHTPEELKHLQEILADKAKAWMAEIALHQLAARYYREMHAERLGQFVLTAQSPAGSTLRALIGEEFIDHVACIGAAHSWDSQQVMETEALSPREICGEPVNLRFLAVLLRLGDLLDLGEGRISTLLWKFLRPLNPVSEAHWRKEHTLRIDGCTPDNIRVSGVFDIDTGGITTAEAYRLALEWLSWLEREVTHCAQILPARVPKEYRKSCKMGELKLDRTGVHAKGLVIGGEVSFQLNRARILELLGNEIYTGGTVFVRELIQNAIDATRIQIVRDHKDKAEKEPLVFPTDRPWDWPHANTGDPRYAINVSIGKEKLGNKEFVTFVVTDQGSGMTLGQIQSHFLHVGVSYYKTPEFRKEFNFPAISQFGIGFLSCITVAQRVEVATRAAGESAGLRLSMQLPSDYYIVQKDTGVAQGTTVKLWIDPSITPSPGWDSGPMDIDAARITGVPTVNGNACLKDKLALSVRQWFPFPEIAILINGKNWGPRSLKFSINTKEALFWTKLKTFADWPVAFRAANGKVLGKGRYWVEVFDSGIPIGIDEFWDSNKFKWLQLHRGVFAGYQDGSFQRACLLWNSNFLPPKSLSASRVLRTKGSPIQEHIWKFQVRLREFVLDSLEASSVELANLYRWLFELGHSKLQSKTLVRHPVRVNGSLEWWTEEECEKRSPVLVVPFGIAWLKKVSSALPLVGSSPQNRGPFDDDADECPLISIQNCCTAKLWPPDAKTKRLEVFSHRATYLGGDLIGLPGKGLKGKPTGESLVKLDSRAIDDSDLPEYDRKQNPWKKNGLRVDHGLFDPKIGIGILANSKLSNAPRFQFPPELFDITIEEGDTWE